MIKWRGLCIRMLLISIVALNLFHGRVGAANQEQIKVTVDGRALIFSDALPYADSANRTQVPLRALSEGLGYGVIWDQTSNTVYVFEVRENGTKIRCLNFSFDSTVVSILDASGSQFSVDDNLTDLESKISNGSVSSYEMDTTPVALNNRTFIPLRYVTSLLDKDVTWNQKTYTVEITSK